MVRQRDVVARGESGFHAVSVERDGTTRANAAMSSLLVAMLVMALAYGAFAYAGVLLARTWFSGEPIEAGPPCGTPPVTAIVLGAAAIGSICGYRGVVLHSELIIAVLCAVLAAIWYIDVMRGIVPDALTLVPLGGLIVAGLLAGRWGTAIAAAITALPFAFMAWRTRGRGMGWGDVKLAALGGAVLGTQDAIAAFAIAAVVAIVLKMRTWNDPRPIAFGPYLACAIVIPLALQTSTLY